MKITYTFEEGKYYNVSINAKYEDRLVYSDMPTIIPVRYSNPGGMKELTLYHGNPLPCSFLSIKSANKMNIKILEVIKPIKEPQLHILGKIEPSNKPVEVIIKMRENK